MKNLAICLLLVVTLFSCKSTKNYTIVHKREVICKNHNYIYIINYPQILRFFKKDSIVKIDFNFLNQDDVEWFCNDTNIVKRNFIYRYKVLYDSDSLICFEFSIKYTSGFSIKSNYPKYQYYCVFVNLKDMTIFSPFQLPAPDKRILKKYVEKFCKRTRIDINLTSYEVDQGTYLTFGITKKYLILYAGNEGELIGGYYKIRIPLSELNYKINVSKIKYDKYEYIYY